MTALVQQNGLKNRHSEECWGIDRVLTTTVVSLNIPEGVLFTDFVKRLKNDRWIHKLN